MILDDQASLDVTFYASKKKPSGQRRTTTWRELAELLTTPVPTPCDCDKATGGECPEKDGFSWSPGALLPGTSRRNENVEHVSALVLDLDGLTAAQIRTVFAALEGLAYVAHSTHSHRPPSRPDAAALRVVVALSRPVPGSDWPSFWHAARAFLGLGSVPLDEACKDPARLYYTPRIPERRLGQFLAYDMPGEALDVDAVQAPRVPLVEVQASSASVPEAPPAPPADPSAYDLQTLEAIVKAQRTKYTRAKDARATWLGRVLDGEPLAPAGERDRTLNAVMSILAVSLPAGTPFEVVYELVRRSVVGMAHPEGEAHWRSEAEDCFARAARRREENDRQRVAQDLAVRHHLLSVVPRELMPQAHREAYDAASAADPSPKANDEDDEHWKTKLKILPPKEGRLPALSPDPLNLRLLLDHVPDWRGVIRWNALTSSIEVVGGPLPVSERDLEVLPQAVANWMAEHFDVRFAVADVKAALLLVARGNAFDPALDYLNRLRWDGVFRADRLLLDYVHGSLDSDLDLPAAEAERLLVEIGTKWLVSCVARVLEPGCQVDTVLVFEGEMGRRKSSFFAALGGPFYTVASVDLADKDTKMVAARSWIIELAELASIMNGRSRESMNAFLTTREDVYRPPYAATIANKARRCVFVGTTEDDDWLTSNKGIRRWWPVRVGERIDIAALERDRDQLWAEAVALYRAGTKWFFEVEDELTLRQVTASRVRTSAVADRVAAWWRAMAPEKRPGTVWVSTVAEQALGKSPGDLTPATEREIAGVLTGMGFTRGARERIGGHRVRVYVPTPELLRLPLVRAGQHAPPFQVIAGGST